jgi:hypothetical protein
LRFRKEPRLWAASLCLKGPERIMALLMVMRVCLPVDAALQYRTRSARKVQQTMYPNPKGLSIQNPTVRWVFQYLWAFPRS